MILGSVSKHQLALIFGKKGDVNIWDLFSVAVAVEKCQVYFWTPGRILLISYSSMKMLWENADITRRQQVTFSEVWWVPAWLLRDSNLSNLNRSPKTKKKQKLLFQSIRKHVCLCDLFQLKTVSTIEEPLDYSYSELSQSNVKALMLNQWVGYWGLPYRESWNWLIRWLN